MPPNKKFGKSRQNLVVKTCTWNHYSKTIIQPAVKILILFWKIMVSATQNYGMAIHYPGNGHTKCVYKIKELKWNSKGFGSENSTS